MPTLKRRRQNIKEKNNKLIINNYVNSTTISLLENKKKNSKSTQNFEILDNNLNCTNNINKTMPIPSTSFYPQIKPCPSTIKQINCYNGGSCNILISENDLNKQLTPPFCRCAPNFHGHNCQYLFNLNIYTSTDLREDEIPLPSFKPFQPFINSSKSSIQTNQNILILPFLLIIWLLIILRNKLF